MRNRKRRKQEKELYLYLRTQFKDIKSCKKWYIKWRNNEQPDILGGCFSLRSMAAHCSNVLEGKLCDDSGLEYCTMYINTKYGSDILFS